MPTGVASAGPATKGALELAPYISERGRAFPGGHCATVGIGGYLLQGGQGWNGRLKGWACESVAAVDVVTAEGTLKAAPMAGITEELPDAALLGAILEHTEGAVFVKMTGPAALVKDSREKFLALVKSATEKK